MNRILSKEASSILRHGRGEGLSLVLLSGEFFSPLWQVEEKGESRKKLWRNSWMTPSAVSVCYAYFHYFRPFFIISRVAQYVALFEATKKYVKIFLPFAWIISTAYNRLIDVNLSMSKVQIRIEIEKKERKSLNLL